MRRVCFLVVVLAVLLGILFAQSPRYEVMLNRPDIVGLTGGGNTKLDGIATTGLSVGTIVLVYDESSGETRIYRLSDTSGVVSDSIPIVIVPDDYNATTNHKVWKLSMSSDADETGSSDTISPGSGDTTDTIVVAAQLKVYGELIADSIQSAGDTLYIDKPFHSVGFNNVGTATITGLATVNGGINITAGGLDIDAGGINVDAGGLNINAGGANITGAVNVTGSETISNALYVDTIDVESYDSVIVNDDLKVVGDLLVTGSITGSYLGAMDTVWANFSAGKSHTTDTVVTYDNLKVYGELIADSIQSAGDSIYIDKPFHSIGFNNVGTANITGNTDIGGDLNVNGDFSANEGIFNGNLTANGGNITNDLTVGDDLSADSIHAGDDVVVSNNLDVGGTGHFGSNVTIDGDLTVNGDLVNGNIGIDTLYRGDKATVTDTIVAYDNFKVHGELIADSIQAAGDTIFVDKPVHTTGLRNVDNDIYAVNSQIHVVDNTDQVMMYLKETVSSSAPGYGLRSDIELNGKNANSTVGSNALSACVWDQTSSSWTRRALGEVGSAIHVAGPPTRDGYSGASGAYFTTSGDTVAGALGTWDSIGTTPPIVLYAGVRGYVDASHRGSSDYYAGYFEGRVKVSSGELIADSIQAAGSTILITDNILVSGGDRYYGVDATGADSFWVYDDGDTTRFDSDNPIKIGHSSIVVDKTGYVTISDGLIVGSDTVIVSGGDISTSGLKAENIIYVAKNGDDTHGDGSLLKPFATIGAAINKVISNGDNSMSKPYTIKIFPGVYNENITLNSDKLVNLHIEGTHTYIGLDVEINGNFTCTSHNDNFSLLTVTGVKITGDIDIEGASNNTNAFATDLNFKDCIINGNVTFKNVKCGGFTHSKIAGNATWENAFGWIDGEPGLMGNLTVTYNSAHNKPSGYDKCYVIISNTIVLGNFTITSDVSNKATLQIRNGARVGSSSSNHTVGNNAVLINYGGNVIRGTITNNGTINNTGGFYDNSTSGLTATDVQSAIDELAGRDKINSDTLYGGDFSDTTDTIVAYDNFKVHGELIADSIQAVGDTLEIDDTVVVHGGLIVDEIPDDNTFDSLLTVVEGMVSKVPTSDLVASKTRLSHVLWVDGENGDDATADGSISKPYKTIQAAINAVSTDDDSFYTIMITPGSYDEALTITNRNINLQSGAGEFGGVEIRGGASPALTFTGNASGDYTFEAHGIIFSSSGHRCLDFTNLGAATIHECEISCGNVSDTAIYIDNSGLSTTPGGWITLHDVYTNRGGLYFKDMDIPFIMYSDIGGKLYATATSGTGYLIAAHCSFRSGSMLGGTYDSTVILDNNIKAAFVSDIFYIGDFVVRGNCQVLKFNNCDVDAAVKIRGTADFVSNGSTIDSLYDATSGDIKLIATSFAHLFVDDNTGAFDVKTSEIMVGDTITEHKYYGTDASGADSFWVYDDGDTTRFDSDNPIKIGHSSLVVGTSGDISLNGSVSFAVKSVTANYTATASDRVILCDATSNSMTVSLPSASGITGRVYTIKKVDSSANTVTIDPNGTETIDGSSTYSLSSQWDFVTIVSDGSNWVIIAK